MTDSQDSPLVFISHASATDDLYGLIVTLSDKLHEAGFRAYLDWDSARRIRGQSYRDELFPSLMRCDAAIVVVSPSALESDWVKNEVFVFVTRRHTQPYFPVIPIFVEGAKPADLEARPDWSPHHLQDYQGFQGFEADSPGLIADTLAQLRPLKDAREALARHGNLYLRLRTLLSTIDRKVLDQALKGLGRDVARHHDASQTLASHLLLSVPQFEQLVELVVVLALSDPEVAEETLDIVLPFTWLHESQVAILRDVVVSPPEKGRGAATNGRWSLTCEMLIRRACREWPPWDICEVALHPTDDSPRGMLDETRRALKHVQKLFDEERVSDQELDQGLAQDPCFLLLPPPPPDSEVLSPVREAFPHLAFLLMGTAPEQLTERGLAFVICLHPPLDTDVEYRVLRERDRVRHHMGRIRGNLGVRRHDG